MSDIDFKANGQATTVNKWFSRSTRVSIDIAAPPERIWALLTDVDSFKSWNSTIIDLSGKIAPGETIRLRSALAPQRIFKLKVKDFEPPKRLSWGDAMGTRVYTLTPNSESGTCFTMYERIGGPIFPLFCSHDPVV